jgi:sugar phosphate isomerase/epimerase
MQFAIQDKLTGLNNQKAVFQMAKEIGFDGVELNLFQKPLDTELTNELLHAIDSSGLPLWWISRLDRTF